MITLAPIRATWKAVLFPIPGVVKSEDIVKEQSHGACASSHVSRHVSRATMISREF